MPYITVNQLNIFYYDNKLEGVPLLFIHGWLGSSFEWSYQLCYFNFKNHIIILDLPGFGKSDKPIADYTVDFFSNQLIDFIKILGYNQVILIGHSLGGLIAQNITIKDPSLVKKVILISSTTAISPSIKEKFKLFWVNVIFKLNYLTFLKKIIKKIVATETENREFRKLYKNSLKLPQTIVLNSFRNMTSKLNFKKQIFQISQPTLIIYGTEDSIILKSTVSELSNLIHNSKIIPVINGSHRLIYNNYGIINNLIDDFINN